MKPLDSVAGDPLNESVERFSKRATVLLRDLCERKNSECGMASIFAIW